MKIIALKEHDDGSATVTFDATQKEKELLIEVGLLTILKKTTKKFYPAPNPQNSIVNKYYADDFTVNHIKNGNYI